MGDTERGGVGGVPNLFERMKALEGDLQTALFNDDRLLGRVESAIKVGPRAREGDRCQPIWVTSVARSDLLAREYTGKYRAKLVNGGSFVGLAGEEDAVVLCDLLEALSEDEAAAVERRALSGHLTVIFSALAPGPGLVCEHIELEDIRPILETYISVETPGRADAIEALLGACGSIRSALSMAWWLYALVDELDGEDRARVLDLLRGGQGLFWSSSPGIWVVPVWAFPDLVTCVVANAGAQRVEQRWGLEVALADLVSEGGQAALRSVVRSVETTVRDVAGNIERLKKALEGSAPRDYEKGPAYVVDLAASGMRLRTALRAFGIEVDRMTCLKRSQSLPSSLEALQRGWGLTGPPPVAEAEKVLREAVPGADALLGSYVEADALTGVKTARWGFLHRGWIAQRVESGESVAQQQREGSIPSLSESAALASSIIDRAIPVSEGGNELARQIQRLSDSSDRIQNRDFRPLRAEVKLVGAQAKRVTQCVDAAITTLTSAGPASSLKTLDEIRATLEPVHDEFVRLLEERLKADVTFVQPAAAASGPVDARGLFVSTAEPGKGGVSLRSLAKIAESLSEMSQHIRTGDIPPDHDWAEGPCVSEAKGNDQRSALRQLGAMIDALEAAIKGGASAAEVMRLFTLAMLWINHGGPEGLYIADAPSVSGASRSDSDEAPSVSDGVPRAPSVSGDRPSVPVEAPGSLQTALGQPRERSGETALDLEELSTGAARVIGLGAQLCVIGVWCECGPWLWNLFERVVAKAGREKVEAQALFVGACLGREVTWSGVGWVRSGKAISRWDSASAGLAKYLKSSRWVTGRLLRSGMGWSTHVTVLGNLVRPLSQWFGAGASCDSVSMADVLDIGAFAGCPSQHLVVDVASGRRRLADADVLRAYFASAEVCRARSRPAEAEAAPGPPRYTKKDYAEDLLMRSCFRVSDDACLYQKLLSSSRRGLYFGGQVAEARETAMAIKEAGVGEFSALFFGLAHGAGDQATAAAMRALSPRVRKELAFE
jgi:outer membrane murein-binding lipoprotein Lpp